MNTIDYVLFAIILFGSGFVLGWINSKGGIEISRSYSPKEPKNVPHVTSAPPPPPTTCGVKYNADFERRFIETFAKSLHDTLKDK